MAEEQEDESSKTEEPTQKKLDDARKRGEIYSSKEVVNWFILLGGAMFIMLVAPYLARSISNYTVQFFESAHTFTASDRGFKDLGSDLVVTFLGFLLFPALIFLIAGIASNLMQNGLMWSAEALQPKLERISPVSGFKRLFSLQSLVEFSKALLKLVIVSALLIFILMPQLKGLELLPTMTMYDLLERMQSIILRLFIGALSILTLIAVVDWLYQRFNYYKKMRMSRYELKQEFKQSEGDPQVKRRLAEIRNERARKRMMQAVPDATVVVTNPTHYSVALKYDPNDKAQAAPRVVAKGKDNIALKIREIAEENGITILQNPPVARGLFNDVEIDHEVPSEYYEIVAKIVGYVLRLKGKMPGAPGKPPTAPADS